MVNHLDYLEKIIDILHKKKNNSDITVVSTIAINEKFSADARKYPLEVQGTAFIPGEYKKVIYTSDEIKNPLIPLDGKDCDLNHDNKKVGTITKTEFKNNKLIYHGIVTDKTVADKIYNMEITKVSPSFSIKDRVMEDKKIFAKGIMFNNMSFLQDKNPVISDTTIQFE